MKANPSPLKLINFYILKNHFDFIEPDADVDGVRFV